MNNKYKVKITDPLLRPGVEIETEALGSTLLETLEEMIKLANEISARFPHYPEPWIISTPPPIPGSADGTVWISSTTEGGPVTISGVGDDN